ncbi:hypothetical protein GCM10025862_32610 [Arsenicicoccus piscis]|uniref:DUF2812 domain-containing protein n=1 Tax=Arsenicicoccus piscis TaxID=673954 RepID=A0ABQ6HUK2_9MICO|nr:hypothetical protein GCM10025862_32610 [Arsenicicoccus piscis]
MSDTTRRIRVRHLQFRWSAGAWEAASRDQVTHTWGLPSAAGWSVELIRAADPRPGRRGPGWTHDDEPADQRVLRFRDPRHHDREGPLLRGARTPAQLRMAVRAYFGAVAIMVLVPLVVWMLTGHPAAFSSAMAAPVFLVLGIQAYRELRAATRSS